MPGPPVPSTKPKKSGRSQNHVKDPNQPSTPDSDAPPPPTRPAVGSGHAAARQVMSPGFDDDDDFSARRPSPAYSDIGDDPDHEPKNILEDVPETTIGENVKVSGNLSFEKLLRIDGEFNGQLQSTGDLIIGRTGTLIGDVSDMGELIIDGKVRGNLTCQKIELRAKAAVFGNITCKSLTMDPTCVVVGIMNVNPNAPEKIDHTGKVIVAPVVVAAPAAVEKKAAAPEKKEKKKKEKKEAPAPVEEKKEEAPAAEEPAAEEPAAEEPAAEEPAAEEPAAEEPAAEEEAPAE